MRNSIASLCLWGVPVGCLALALAFWDHSLALQCAAVGFALLYTFVYRRIVRFGVPAWLVVRANAEPADDAPDGAEAEV
jgi:hypothetical protein